MLFMIHYIYGHFIHSFIQFSKKVSSSCMWTVFHSFFFSLFFLILQRSFEKVKGKKRKKNLNCCFEGWLVGWLLWSYRLWCVYIVMVVDARTLYNCFFCVLFALYAVLMMMMMMIMKMMRPASQAQKKKKKPGALITIIIIIIIVDDDDNEKKGWWIVLYR